MTEAIMAEATMAEVHVEAEVMAEATMAEAEGKGKRPCEWNSTGDVINVIIKPVQLLII